MLVANINDVVVYDSGSVLKVGKIIQLIPFTDQEIRKVRDESEGHDSIQAVANLCRLTKDSGDIYTEVSNDPKETSPNVSRDSPRSNPKRDAAAKAQQKWLSQFLVTRQ